MGSVKLFVLTNYVLPRGRKNSAAPGNLQLALSLCDKKLCAFFSAVGITNSRIILSRIANSAELCPFGCKRTKFEAHLTKATPTHYYWAKGSNPIFKKTLKASPLSNRKSERLAAQDTLGESTLKECPIFRNGKLLFSASMQLLHFPITAAYCTNKKRPGEPDLF